MRTHKWKWVTFLGELFKNQVRVSLEWVCILYLLCLRPVFVPNFLSCFVLSLRCWWAGPLPFDWRTSGSRSSTWQRCGPRPTEADPSCWSWSCTCPCSTFQRCRTLGRGSRTWDWGASRSRPRKSIAVGPAIINTITVHLPDKSDIWVQKISLEAEYSGDLKSGNIWNWDFLKVGFQMIRFSNGWALAMAIIALTIQKLDVFVWILNGFWQNGGHLFGFQMVGLPDFRSHSKSYLFLTIQNPD